MNRAGPKTMTLKAFKQAYCAALSYWKFSERSNIHVWQPVRVYTSEAMFCPITAVHYHKTGAYVETCDWRIAARQIGLSSELAFKIVRAADHRERGSKGTLARWLQDHTMKAIQAYSEDF